MSTISANEKGTKGSAEEEVGVVALHTVMTAEHQHGSPDRLLQGGAPLRRGTIAADVHGPIGRGTLTILVGAKHIMKIDGTALRLGVVGRRRSRALGRTRPSRGSVCRARRLHHGGETHPEEGVGTVLLVVTLAQDPSRPPTRLAHDRLEDDVTAVPAPALLDHRRPRPPPLATA